MSREIPEPDIVPFDRRYERAGFSCGEPGLDEWLVRYSGQSERKHTTRTFLAVDHVSNTVLGYYATTAIEIQPDSTGRTSASGKRRYPMPAILIARLAVDRAAQGRGLGGILLTDALCRILEASKSVGFEVVVVDAIDLDASTFYRRYGFTPFADDELHLFMTTKTLRATFLAAGE